MKKIALFFLFTALACVAVIAQTSNVKIIFPNPVNYEDSRGQFLIQTADNGFLLAGTTSDKISGNYGVPRLIKLAADLSVEWDRNYLEQSPPHGMTASLYSPAMQTSDGGYALAVRNDSSATDFLRLDAAGNVLWEKDLVPWSSFFQLLGVLPDGSFLLTHKAGPYDLFHLDADGNTITRSTLVTGASNGHIRSVTLTGGDVLTAYAVQNSTRLLRSDAAGNQIWQSQVLSNISWLDNQGGTKLAATPDGGFVLLAYDPNVNHNRVYRFDGAGALLWTSPATAWPDTWIATAISVRPTGEIVLAGRTVTNRGFLAQLNATADVVEWSVESPEDGQDHLGYLDACVPSADGWAAGVGESTDTQFGFLKAGDNTGIHINTLTGRAAKDDNENCAVDAAESGLKYVRVTAQSATETFGAFTGNDGQYTLLLPAGDFSLSVTANDPFFEFCAAANNQISFPPNASGSATLDLPMTVLETIHEVKGSLYLDQNANCTVDPGEPTLPNWNLTLHHQQGNLPLSTDADGHYSVFLPTGEYSLTALPYNNQFEICAPATHTLNFPGPDPETRVIDFVVNPEFLCAKMRTYLSASPVRPCSTFLLYAYYRNDGTNIAQDATLTVTLDPQLTFVSATVTPSLVDGQSIHFDLGDLPPAPGSIWDFIVLNVTASCDLAIGDQVCADAAVTPNEDCTQEQNWNGAIVSASGTCENNNQAVFKLTNVGTAPNAGPLNFIITEDQIVLLQGTFQLNPQEEQTETVAGNGLPLVLYAQQEPGYPGDTTVVWNIVNCGGNGSGQWSGFGGSAGPFTQQECFVVVNSFDPNDKNAIPEGRGPGHMVQHGTPLEYHIRFQNTGTDTAFLVVIRDTLDANFDLSSVEALGSSHRYEFARIGDRILQFTFNNILLPDSSANLAGSQGFVDFRVYPKGGLADGTVVENSAAIYFDFNEPVITNTVRRTYGKFVFLKTDDIAASVPVKIYPNPFIDEATFELPENEDATGCQLQLLDVQGRTLRQIDFSGNTCRLIRRDLPAGALHWRVTRAGNVLAGGTVISE